MLTANRSTLMRDGKQFDYGLKAQTNPTKIYQGSVVQLNGNHVEKAAGATGKRYVGITLLEATSGASDGAVKVPVRRRVAAKLKTASGGRHDAAGALGVGDTAYLEDDETVTKQNEVAAANTVDRSELGEVLAVDTDGVWVWIE